MSRKARVRATGGAFDVECRNGLVLLGFIGCPTRALADEVAVAFVNNGYSAAQKCKAKMLAAKAQSTPRPPDCERCGFPAYNINRNDEHTGRHLNERECFRAVYEAAVTKAKEELSEDLAEAINSHVSGYHASEA